MTSGPAPDRDRSSRPPDGPRRRARPHPGTPPVPARPRSTAAVVASGRGRGQAALTDDARLPAAAIAVRTGCPQSTVRRRLAALTEAGKLGTQVVIDPRRLGLTIDASVMLRVPPDHLASAGRALAEHPAVHRAFATSGASNLYAAVWVRDLAALYTFLAEDLTGLGITHTDTAIVAHAVKRPGGRAARDPSRAGSGQTGSRQTEFGQGVFRRTELRQPDFRQPDFR